jgi:hypothetical protein
MASKEELEANLKQARLAVAEAELALEAWAEKPENNVFPDMDTATYEVEEALQTMARNDCEGAHNRGAPSYSRRFMVDGKTYEGTLTVEYNRHDKTYYYVDESEFTFKEIA